MTGRYTFRIMPKTTLTYDDRNMFADRAALRGLRAKLKTAKKTILDQAESGEQGWLMLPEDTVMVKRILAMAKDVSSFTTCLVIGIGGSDLGTRAVYSALGSGKGAMALRFAGANTDPDELHAVLETLDLKKTLVNIISKSGDTIEPMATFLVVREALKKAVGKNYSRHVVATTDERTGTLREMADREGFRTLPVPSNVGGRFSVLCDVSLFPLACAGIDIRGLLKGASAQRAEWTSAERFAALQYLAYAKRDRRIHVLMPYSERLREFGFWYRQLWAESLGKDGKGPTPVAAIGATDQHSQIQLYNDGPDDKTVTFIEVEAFDHDLRIPKDAHAPKKLRALGGLSFERIIHAEREATAIALTANTRANGTIRLRNVSCEGLGALIMFFEIATAVSGVLYGINAYDQPGVEAGKKAMHKLLRA